MAESYAARSNPGTGGMFSNLRETFASLAGYLHARLRLAGLESKEALVHYLKIIAWVVIALMVVVFGYLFFCIGLVVLIARLIGVHWPWVMVAFALAHFGFAVLCVFMAKSRLGAPMFTTTLHEFRKDKEWLSSQR